MGTSSRHEELKKWLATLLEQYFIARRVPAYPRGQATIKRMEQAGAEPDESWSFGERKEIPDLVLEPPQQQHRARVGRVCEIDSGPARRMSLPRS